ncbi:18301_t:CDS:2, partial [Acaulospora morrowiae]
AAPIQIDSSALTVPKDKLDAAFKSSTSPAEKFEDDAWLSSDKTPVLLPKPIAKPSSQMTLMTFQSSQMALQPPINTQTPSLPPAPLAAAVVPLNTILHQPLIPMKNEIPSQFSTLPITNINNLRNNNQGLMGNLPVNNYSPGNTWNNSGIVPTPLPVETHSGYSTLGVTNQFNANFNTENQIQPTLLNTPQLPPTTTQSSACDPKVVFAAMKTGQIGPNIIPNATDDKYSAFKQVDLQGPSVFNGPTPNQLSTNGYNLGQNPGVLNTPSWNQTATGGFSGMGVPQQNPSYPPLANPNVNFGLNGQQPPNQQGFNNTPGYNNLNQNHKW